MPEGDTIYRAAATLRKALLGRTLLRFETDVPALQRVVERAPLAGRTVAEVEPRGKHLLMAFRPPDAASAEEDLVLHTHMRMTGSWHIYRPGERFQKPARLARVILYTDAYVAPCFSAPVVELLTRRQLLRHPELTPLGPDAMDEGFNVAEALRRLRARPEAEIAVALLDQRSFAGVGNVYKSELLFLHGVPPRRRVQDVDDAALAGLLQEAGRLLRRNRAAAARRTRFGVHDGHSTLWVYGRAGEPCLRCGAPIERTRQGEGLRSTYFCPRCQA